MTDPRRILAIANRSEIAIRIARTARGLGWQPVALLGDPDLRSFAAREIGAFERVGPAGSELDADLVVKAALRAGATALHPGYGFLSEKPELSAACAAAGIVFVGPSPETLALCGDKFATRLAAERARLPMLSASELLSLENEVDWWDAAEAVGFPLIAKVSGGGGGRGLRVARAADELDGAIRSALREAGASGAGVELYLERYLEGARHVEAQVAGDGADAVALGDRDCSIQRRHQKVVEEAPAFGVNTLRPQLHQHAVSIAREVGLCGLATVEFLLARSGELAFIEINPRLQVEHTVTEEVTGLDLVEIQLALAYSGALPESVEPRGHAIQARLYAEDPARDFAPSPGLIRVLDWPRGAGIRVEAGYEAGDTVPSHYDSLVGKLIVWGESRKVAIDRLEVALATFRVGGIATNRPWLKVLAANHAFKAMLHDLGTAGQIQIIPDRPMEPSIKAVAEQLLSGRCNDAWSSVGPFRVVAPCQLALHGEQPDWQARVSYERSASGGWDANPSIVPEPNPDDWDSSAITWRPDLERAAAVVLPTNDGFEVSDTLGRWLVKLGPLPRESAAGARADGALRAPMPGTVVAVNVAVGQRVRKDEVLAVMTAMKMELALAAPFDGVVTAVGAAVGELVGSQQPLVTVAPNAEAGGEHERGN